MFDLDNDGDLDIVTNDFNSAPQVLVSDLAQVRNIHWLKVVLIGTHSNRNGLGATVRVQAAGQTYTKYNDGKSGYLSQSVLPLYFGLGDATKIDLPALRFEYHSAPLEHLINNGKTIRVNYHAPGSGDYLVIGDARYQLTQFHFHHPSEEYVHGKPYDMVAHLMHEATDGTVVGVAVLLKAGAANPTVQQLWDHMPANVDYENDVPGVDINPANLLPQSLSYYTYMGSGTAPPCVEGVKWIVLETPVDVSREQIEAFAKLFPHDVRPTQPLNGRIVEESR